MDAYTLDELIAVYSALVFVSSSVERPEIRSAAAKTWAALMAP